MRLKRVQRFQGYRKWTTPDYAANLKVLQHYTHLNGIKTIA